MGFFDELFKKPDPQDIYVKTMEELNEQISSLMKIWISELNYKNHINHLNSFLTNEFTLIFIWGVACNTHERYGGEDDIEGRFEILRQSMLFSISKSEGYPKYIKDIKEFGFSSSGYKNKIYHKLLNKQDDEHDSTMWYFEHGLKFSDDTRYKTPINSNKLIAVKNLVETFIDKLNWEKNNK